jgi:hypothetical protein
MNESWFKYGTYDCFFNGRFKRPFLKMAKKYQKIR